MNEKIKSKAQELYPVESRAKWADKTMLEKVCVMKELQNGIHIELGKK